MKFRILVSPDAGEELARISLWLDEQRQGFGEILLDEFEDAIEHLSKYPLSQEKRSGGYRQLKFGRFQ